MNTGATLAAAVAVLVLAGCSSPPPAAPPKDENTAAARPKAGAPDAFTRADQIIAELKQREQAQPAPPQAAPPMSGTSGNTTPSRFFGRATSVGGAGIPSDFDPSRADEKTWKATVRVVEAGLAEAQKEAQYAANRLKFATRNLRNNKGTGGAFDNDSLDKNYAEAIAAQEHWKQVIAAYVAAITRLRDVAAKNNIPDSWLRP